MLYQFVGSTTQVFPTILTDTGTLVAEPGQLVELDTDPGHADLVPVATPNKLDPTTVVAGTFLAGEHGPDLIDPAPESTIDPTDPED